MESEVKIMADNVISTKLKQRYDTESNWTSKNPVLLAGELAISSDKDGLYKVGNGSSRWSELTYSGLSTFRKKNFGTVGGNGTYMYAKLCTITIASQYINTPFEIALQGRGRATIDRLSVLFQSINNTDPALTSFNVIGAFNGYYISKITTSTWAIYVTFNETWGAYTIRDYSEQSGINVTWNLEACSALPSSKTQASFLNVTTSEVTASSKMVIPVLSSDPSSPTTGQIWINTSA